MQPQVELGLVEPPLGVRLLEPFDDRLAFVVGDAQRPGVHGSGHVPILRARGGGDHRGFPRLAPEVIPHTVSLSWGR
ncbi:hypothetical protein Airi02_077580 [Actinoallomurus iriomotensis]|uniref:Uncharacterized protein n=1 Tax=Actinoallomurus iriomotensis TaxID=478107 RepID=A0A9W6W3V1_9ACTN|nr:hypothetical protein Airi02_077580 [Actinoallomurus iriomotensis]